MLTTTLLQGAVKQFTSGTHRICDPAETYHAILPHFKMMGITRIADVTGLDVVGIPVCMAIRPNSRSLSVAQGKGPTLMHAKVSAAMESTEGYHAENIDQPIVEASYRELAQTAVCCDPATLNLHPQTIYREDLSFPWIRGHDVIGDTDTWVPYDLVHTDYRYRPADRPMFSMSSNGLASGNHILEAISHAICEVVERDATALWELRIAAPEADESYVDLATIDSLACQELLEKIERADLMAYVSHQTTDVGIPSFGCIILDHQSTNALFTSVMFGGYGCHLSKEIALSRAITEAVQSRLTQISGARDDMSRQSYLLGRSRFYQAERETIYAKIRPAVDFRKLPSLETDSLGEDVAVQLSLLKKAGFKQVIILDLTLPHIGIPVVRVVIPGMEMNHGTGFTQRLGRRAKVKRTQDLLASRIFAGMPK